MRSESLFGLSLITLIFNDDAAREVATTLQRHQISNADVTFNVDIGADRAAPADDGVAPDQNEIANTGIGTDLDASTKPPENIVTAINSCESPRHPSAGGVVMNRIVKIAAVVFPLACLAGNCATTPRSSEGPERHLPATRSQEEDVRRLE
jgi:hypothetical protein